MGHGGHGFKPPLSLHDFFPSWNLIIFSIYWFLALLLTYINQKKSLIISFYNFQNLDSVGNKRVNSLLATYIAKKLFSAFFLTFLYTYR